MSLIRAISAPPLWAAILYSAGSAFVKNAGDATVAYNLAGRLYLSKSGWLLLSVPNSFARGVFSAMNEPGIELPPGVAGGPFEAHISVMRPDEIDMLGGSDKITERGKEFNYTLGRIYEVTPNEEAEFAKVWFVKVHSPDLQYLRRSYGLTSLPHDGEYDFHVTVAVRRKRVLGRNQTSKTN